MTFSDAERLAREAEEVESALEMDEDAFRAFYERTARILWAYLSRMTGDRQAADDLLQEAYYRFIRSGARLEDEAHRRHYLFRIATNLVNDRFRRLRARDEPLDEVAASRLAADSAESERGIERRQLRQGLARLKRREREMLWLAYAEGLSHREIADVFGIKTSGVRVLLFRARRRLAALLGHRPSRKGETGGE